MTGWTLLLRSLRFHWRSHLGVFLGAALATAILVGALAVGDSVKHSLRTIALNRIGEVRLALNGKGRFFRADLAKELAPDVKSPVVPILLIRGTAASDTGEARAANIQVVGVPAEFWGLGPAGKKLETGPDGVLLNRRLAERLKTSSGAEVVLRVDKPSVLSRDAPLSTTEDSSVALRLPVRGVAGDAEFGRFSLEANQIAPFTAFVPLARLQRELELPGRANIILVGGRPGAEPSLDAAGTSLTTHWKLADANLEIRRLQHPPELELRTERVFIDAPVAHAALENDLIPGRGILSYFVNELSSGGRSTPYSLVTAMDGGGLPSGMQDDEVVINRWLADDLQAKAGDTLALRYYVVGAKRKLTEQTSEYRIREIVPMEAVARDRNLMPAFPGVADAENCRDWKPGIPIDLDRIRDKDEVYWDAYRGTPKAFLTLAAGQKIWNNRFGNLTAVRYSEKTTPGAVEACLRQSLSPAALGLVFVPVRQQALAASSQALDFGQLFLGFSFFLIVAALLLTALLFGLGAEQRAEETGILLALGFPAKRVRRLLLAEGALIAGAAGIVGAFAGVLYTQAVIRGLSTVWSGAVAQSALFYHAQPATLAGGAVAGFVVSLLSIWFVSRKQAAQPARELLSAGADHESHLVIPATGRRTGVPTAALAGAAAIALLYLALTADHSSAAGYFFGAGAALLISGLALCRAYLGRLERASAQSDLTLGSLGVRNTTRRRTRSLAAIGLLACGSFLVIAVGANRHDPTQGAEKRTSGTGGFAFYAESTLPVYHDLNAADGRDAFGLAEEEMAGVNVLPMRLREGDEASCLNLNRAQAPRLLGVDPAQLEALGAFTFAGATENVSGAAAWGLLNRPGPDADTVNAIGDANTVLWGLGKKLGDTIPYVDDRGRQFKLRIVGTVAPSVLQGALLISEQRFIERFPSQSGYQVFLIDAPKARAAEVSETLGRAMEDIGLDISSAPERLAQFNTVENTYLSIFAVLGGLGLLLGSVGLGIIVLRNVLERRGELALLRAVGFTGRKLQWLVFSEHSLLLGLGLLVGVLAALVAVLPALRSPGAEVPYGSLTVILLAVLASGFLWVWGATAVSLRGPLMQALRSE